MSDMNGKDLRGALADIRETEYPGRNGDFPYARLVSACFEEIAELKDEGFSMATIRRFLEKKGALAPGSDPRSFCRAFRREFARRMRRAKSKGMRDKAANVRSVASDRPVPAETKTKVVHESAKPNSRKPARGLQVNSDNTFTIRPIDENDLPEI